MSEKLFVRVLAGGLKGRRLISPNDRRTHPMGAREKLALFNMVTVSGKKVLDLYAGTGALGIEALSRGADEAVFVEKSPAVAKIVRENLQGLKAQVFCESCQRFCENPEFLGYFDVILADPPYDQAKPEELARVADLLQVGGVLAVSTPAKEPAWELAGLELQKSRTYAGARISIFSKSE